MYLSLSIYIYIYTHDIYLSLSLSLSLSLYIYIYIYIYPDPQDRAFPGMQVSRKISKITSTMTTSAQYSVWRVRAPGQRHPSGI